MRVFWSWQSDVPGKNGRHFIRNCLQAAINKLAEASEIEEPIEREVRANLELDQDRKGVPGSPDLARLIFEKIDRAQVFVADVTPVGEVTTGGADGGSRRKKLANSNVSIELGYALHALGDNKLLMIMNEFYGTRENLPFDLSAKAGPILYKLAPDASSVEISEAMRNLTAKFVEALRSYIGQHVEAVRRETRFPDAPEHSPGMFRRSSLAIGKRWDPLFNGSDDEVFLRDGAVAWFRLLPAHGPDRKLRQTAMREAATRPQYQLLPLLIANLFMIRDEDGIGMCSLDKAGDLESESIAFFLTTGEIWAIDTQILSHEGKIFPAAIEKQYTRALTDYAQVSERVGIKPPFQWIAGLHGVRNRGLIVPVQPNHAQSSLFRAPKCLSLTIRASGSYDGQESPVSALLPFFDEIYGACAVDRPTWLPNK